MSTIAMMRRLIAPAIAMLLLGCGPDRGAQVEQVLEEAAVQPTPLGDRDPAPLVDDEVSAQARLDLTALEGKVAALAGTAKVADDDRLHARVGALQERAIVLRQRFDELQAGDEPIDKLEAALWRQLRQDLQEAAAEADALMAATPLAG